MRGCPSSAPGCLANRALHSVFYRGLPLPHRFPVWTIRCASYRNLSMPLQSARRAREPGQASRRDQRNPSAAALAQAQIFRIGARSKPALMGEYRRAAHRPALFRLPWPLQPRAPAFSRQFSFCSLLMSSWWLWILGSSFWSSGLSRLPARDQSPNHIVCLGAFGQRNLCFRDSIRSRLQYTNAGCHQGRFGQQFAGTKR